VQEILVLALIGSLLPNFSSLSLFVIQIQKADARRIVTVLKSDQDHFSKPFRQVHPMEPRMRRTSTIARMIEVFVSLSPGSLL